MSSRHPVSDTPKLFLEKSSGHRACTGNCRYQLSLSFRPFDTQRSPSFVNHTQLLMERDQCDDTKMNNKNTRKMRGYDRVAGHFHHRNQRTERKNQQSVYDYRMSRTGSSSEDSGPSPPLARAGFTERRFFGWLPLKPSATAQSELRVFSQA